MTFLNHIRGLVPAHLQRSFVAITTALVAVGAVLVPAANAAAGDKSRVEDGWNLRECGTSASACGVFGYTVGDQDDQTWCWRDGGGIRWFKITSWINANGTEKWKTGWISAGAVTRQATVPWCSSWDL